MRYFLAVLLVQALQVVAPAADWYVRPNTTLAPWDGTDGDPYPSVLDALTDDQGTPSYRITSGDTIYVDSGVYPQQFQLATVNTDGSGAPRNVRIIGYGSTVPIIGTAAPAPVSGPYLAGPAVFILGGQSSDCQIKNFVIQGWNSDENYGAITVVPHSTNGGSSPHIENVDFVTNAITGGVGEFLAMGPAVTIYERCNPTLLLCAFVSNRAGLSNGAGLYGGAIGIGARGINNTYPDFPQFSMPRPIISRCAFTDNEAKCRGGAIAIVAAGPIISDCEFRDNKAADGGGAIFCKMTDGLRVEGCRFYGNAAVNGTLEPSVGGAILASWTVDDDDNEATAPDPIRIIDNEFGSLDPANPGNSGSMAGAVLVANADCTISHNRFLGNEAKGVSIGGVTVGLAAALAVVGIDTQASGTFGEAMSVTIDPNADVVVEARIVNNLFAENIFSPGLLTVLQDVVWLQARDEDPSLAIDLMATLVNNTLTSHGFASFLVEGGGGDASVKAEFQNNILWDPPIDPQIATGGTVSIATSDNDSNQALGGSGDISGDPLFVSSPDNVNLSALSPCLHTGDDSAWLRIRARDPSIPNRDLGGGTRIVGSAIDMGCEEYVAPVFGP